MFSRTWHGPTRHGVDEDQDGRERRIYTLEVCVSFLLFRMGCLFLILGIMLLRCTFQHWEVAVVNPSERMPTDEETPQALLLRLFEPEAASDTLHALRPPPPPPPHHHHPLALPHTQS